MIDGTTFPSYRFSGTHREIGRQFGEATRDLIWRHRDLAVSRLGTNSGISAEQALAAAMRYRPFVQQYAPFLDEEIIGVAQVVSHTASQVVVRVRSLLGTLPATAVINVVAIHD